MASAPMLDPATANALRQAMGAAQAGDLARARMIAENALAGGGDIVALNAFLGMLRARSGDPAGAVTHLRAAHHGRPEDTTIACNLVATLVETGDLATALEVATRDRALADPTLRIARYRGFAAQALERYEEAVEAYRHVVAAAPGDFESWNNLGNALSATGDFAGSVAALERAVALDPQAAPTRLNLAEALRNADRIDDAAAVLRKAAEDFPDDGRPLHELYVLFKREARHEEALPAIEGAVARDPDNPNLQLKLGVEYGLVRRVDEAQAAFRHAIAHDPKLVDAYLGLVIQYEHTNREDQFAPLIALAEANGLDEGPLGFLRAMEHRRAGRFEEGLAALAQVPPEVEPERTIHIRATLLDRLGRSDEAFADFQETNRLHGESPTEPLRRAEELRDELKAEVAAFTPEWVAGWKPATPPAGDGADPVFLVGFPRSGTTLLDTILMGHPATTVMEEQPPLNYVDKETGGFFAIPGMDDAAIAAARAQYRDEVAKVAEVPAGSMLIDKSPLFLQKAALIARIFPNARFILALRHPCDVLLSCFMSNFRLNSAMANFLRLEDAAAYYDLTFRHWERARELLPLNVHTIVYEQLVEDVAAEVRPLFDFLGLEWREEALDHTRTAKARGLITTASYSQVTEPIYKRAAGRWTRYRKHLEPVLPVLEPWAERFGYSL
ncbi:tetratricopeptide repeat-containing sulfotransferase family protein [Sphingomonas canadensis]|uniref:Tetratricopeptide repeat-containing sulfotransferase family protein n=1 Tax=Sphingomonas canadensis TaxID=1219257 RepID=A0ABW3H7Z7_9SPHN|nr:tetratricopeptide repeat-containing sulfotransferase family protein [Sphingomonas canadensis]MCW3837139.1 sulfotransferase [Sphingomonas canadensis]